MSRPLVVVKLGSSSVTRSDGSVHAELLSAIAQQIVDLRAAGTDVVLVSSGAIAAGWAAIGQGAERPRDASVLQAVSAIGQHRLVTSWQEAFDRHEIHVGQVLLAPYDFIHREQYLFARSTLDHLLALGAVPIVNENDATADEEIRFGDNDRLAALVAHLLGASSLVLLTDLAGLFTADPRQDKNATLIEEVAEIDGALEALASGPGSELGSGGMASKLAAARMATWSGVSVTIAEAKLPEVIAGALRGEAVGTRFLARESTLSARKLWIAFALPAKGVVSIDEGAARALERAGSSLLGVGVSGLSGSFVSGEAVEIRGPSGEILAKGLSTASSEDIAAALAAEPSVLGTLVHRDDLVVLAGFSH